MKKSKFLIIILVLFTFLLVFTYYYTKPSSSVHATYNTTEDKDLDLKKNNESNTDHNLDSNIKGLKKSKKTNELTDNSAIEKNEGRMTIDFNYRYPGDKIYIYGIYNHHWFAKNTRNLKIFDISNDAKYLPTTRKLDNLYPGARM